MTTTPVGTTPLRDRVAEEVRAQLARRRMSASKLGKELGVSQTYVWRRLTGETALDLNDLEAIAGVLGVEVADLLPADLRRTLQTKGGTLPPPIRPIDNRPPGRPDRSVTTPGRPRRTSRIKHPEYVPESRRAA